MKELAAPPSAGRPAGGAAVQQPSLGKRCLAHLAAALIRLLQASVRLEYEDQSGFLRRPENGPAIFCVWHNRLALGMALYDRYARLDRPVRGLTALVSASRDGAFLAAVLEKFGVAAARGSSSRRGSQALLELGSRAQAGFDLAVTPDGPRGPRYVLQEGIIALAAMTGLPIVPVGWHARRKFCLRSWDQFQIPCPLTRVAVTFGPVLTVPRECREAERLRWRDALQQRMQAITRD